MVVYEELLEELEALDPRAFQALVFRHTLGDSRPETENVRGGRWNPENLAAIYTSLERGTAIAEGDHLLDSLSPRPHMRRVVHRIQVGLERVLDLRLPEILDRLEIDQETLRSTDPWSCQRVGEAAKRLGTDGIWSPPPEPTAPTS